MTRTGKLCASTLITLVTGNDYADCSLTLISLTNRVATWLGGNCVAPTSLCSNSLGSLRVEFDSQFQPRSGGCL
jgi:hypothetical protein